MGASGSGTTSLGRALSQELNIPHFDTDDFFWEETDPPFTEIRSTDKRKELIKEVIEDKDSWIISGSLTKWGDFLIPLFDIVIFLYVEKDIRIHRLKKREKERFGSRIEPGGDMYKNHEEFIAWASSYDKGGMEMRSKTREEAWLERLDCKVVKIIGDVSVEEQISYCIKNL